MAFAILSKTPVEKTDGKLAGDDSLELRRRVIATTSRIESICVASEDWLAEA